MLMKAMILAAGLGSRLSPYTAIRPKPLFPVLGEPLLLRILSGLRQAGFTQIVVNAYHLKDQLVDRLSQEKDVILQVEPVELGTGGGLGLAYETLRPGPVLVTNADIYHDVDYRWVYESHCQEQVAATLVMHDYPRFNKVLVNRGGRVLSFVPDTCDEAGDRRLAFTGIHVVDTDLLKTIPSGEFSSIIDVYERFVGGGGVMKAIVPDALFWHDIGTPADYLGLHAGLLTGGEGGTQSPSSGERFVFGPGVVKEEGVVCKDWGFVGANVHIGADSHLERVVVWDGAKIPPGTWAHDVIIPQ